MYRLGLKKDWALNTSKNTITPTTYGSDVNPEVSLQKAVIDDLTVNNDIINEGLLTTTDLKVDDSANIDNLVVNNDTVNGGLLTTNDLTVNSATNVANLTVTTTVNTTTAAWNTDGNTNYFFGLNTGNSNANYNTGFGINNQTSSTGSWNTSVGYNSQSSNTSGLKNTSMGYNSMGSNTSGYINTAIGMNSLLNNIDGNNNTVVGVNSLLYNVSGISNVAVGMLAGSNSNNESGNFNTFIGYNASSASSSNSFAYSTAIGYDSEITESNQIMMGTSAETVIVPGKLRGAIQLSTAGYMCSGSWNVPQPIICSMSNYYTGQTNTDKSWIVNPGFIIVKYEGANYSGTEQEIDNSTGLNPLTEDSDEPLTLKSIKVYFKSKDNEITSPMD
ncbi:hypothetical protein N8459_02675 [Nitrosopumilus sp.]|nr:hypothetical protein [Nitrosopumilus sp.]